MRVLALVSGGKDSIMAMLECVAHGHEIVGLANLHPPLDFSSDEMDSYMFQTVGHSVVACYGECMDLPLFRASILGKSVNQDLSYEPNCDDAKRDEVEDLYSLIRHAKEEITGGFDAVCSGAIFSNYQRLRVENVCQRLRLVSLAYLWEGDQAKLLQMMIKCEITAILCKTASMGLLPKEHLGKSIAEMKEHLLYLANEFGCNECGEGGEYETLTLDCPLFRKRIILKETEIVGDIDNPVSPIGYLQIDDYCVEQKDARQSNIQLQQTIEHIKRVRLAESSDSLYSSAIQAELNKLNRFNGPEVKCVNRTTMDCQFYMYSWPNLFTDSLPNTLEDQVEHMFNDLNSYLVRSHLTMVDIYFVNLYLDDMNTFPTVNNIYKKKFNKSFPARFCVELREFEDTTLRVQFLISRNVKTTLHVQSISHWAPSNIGPYSQASQISGIAFLAGQIALDPATLTVVNPVDPFGQLSKCLDNCSRVLQRMRSSQKSTLSLVVFIQKIRFVRVMKHICQKMFPENTLKIFLVVPRLPRNALVEIQITASVSSSDTIFKCAVPELHSPHINFNVVNNGGSSLFGLYSQNLSEHMDASETAKSVCEAMRSNNKCFSNLGSLQVFYLPHLTSRFANDMRSFLIETLQAFECFHIIPSFVPIESISASTSDCDTVAIAVTWIFFE